MVVPKRFLRLTWFSSAVSYEAAGKMQRLTYRRKTTKVVQHKSSRSPLPRRVAGKFYVERVCDDVLFPLFADSSARGLYIHDPKLICNKSAQRPEEIQNKSHGLACSPLCSISFANPETHRFNFNS